MSEPMKKSVEEIIADLFTDSPTVDSLEVTLPSLAKGYQKTKKVIKVRSMTFEDEKFIAQYRGDELLEELLKMCVEDIDPEELYLEDKLFLYYKIRESSFGTAAKLSANCDICNVPNDLEVDLSQLDITYASDDFEDPQKIMLPNLKKEVLVSRVRAYTSEYTKNQDTILDNLWRFVVKVDSYEDPVVISKIIKKLSSADIRTIIRALNSKDFGIDTKVKYLCSACGRENVAVVGLTIDFFTMS